MTSETMADEDASPHEDLMQADGMMTTRSDFWVGLLVLGGTCYGLLVAARILFF